MCQKKPKSKECGQLSSQKNKCCCVDKPDSQISLNDIKQCISDLRNKADYIETKLSYK